MKSHAFYFALLSACIIFNFVEDRRHLNKKMKSHAFYFVLHSVCTIFSNLRLKKIGCTSG